MRVFPLAGRRVSSSWQRLGLSAALTLAVAGTGCAPALLHVAMGTERGQSSLREHEVVVGGVRHTVLSRRGDGAGPTAVLLHGFGGDKDNWTRMAAHLPSSWNLLIPDLAGFGQSERREDVHHDIVAQAERVHLLIQQAESRPVILVGNSMGGHIAAATAALYPDDVAFSGFAPESASRWVSTDPQARLALTGGPLLIRGSMPVLCSAGCLPSPPRCALPSPGGSQTPCSPPASTTSTA